VLSGRIAAPNIRSVSLNNCLLDTGIYLIKQKKIDLSYTTENIYPYWWMKLFRKLNIEDYLKWLEQDQYYVIESPGRVNVHSSRKSTDKTGLFVNDNDKKEYRVGYKLKLAEEQALKIHINLDYQSGQTDEKTDINNLSLAALSFTGTPAGKISIENITVSNWYMSEFSPKEELSFYDITPKPDQTDGTKVGIHKCNLGNAWFDNVDFDQFDLLSFHRSKFAKSTFTSCSFPDQYGRFEKFTSVPNVHYPNEKTVNEHKDQYEMFLQLKKAFEATGNYYEGLKLQAMSYDALNKIETISAADKFILNLNKVSNNHGLSIKWPFLWFMGFTVLFYIFYLLSLRRIFQSTDFDANLIGYYFSFIDITHRIDFLTKEPLNGFALVVDYFNKVIMGYLIYQFIASFRKYGRN
jgi:hypothetical protein